MNTNQMRALEDTCRHRCQGSSQAVGNGLATERAFGEERLSGGAAEQGESQLMQLAEVGKQRKIFVEALSKAKSRIKDNALALDAGLRGALREAAQIFQHQGRYFRCF